MSSLFTLPQPLQACASPLGLRRVFYASNVNPSTDVARGACYAPSMLRPDVTVDAVHVVTAPWLQARGLQGLLVDLDDTLLSSSDESPLDPRSEAWFNSLREAGIPVVILSNGEPARVAALAAQLGVEGLALAGKPFPIAFRRALRRLGVPADRTAMIGDQLFTDVLGANLAGMTSVLVTPLSAGKLPHTRVARMLERWILKGGGRGCLVHR